MGAVIAVLVLEAILEGSLLNVNGTGSALVFGILRVTLEGGGLGFVGAWFLILMLRNYWLPDYLQNGVTLMVVVLVFAIANNLAPEAGLLATTVMGLVLANQKVVLINRTIAFTEDLQVILIGVLFILLSARISLDSLMGVITWQGGAYLLLLILIARPLSVFVTAMFSELTWRERLFSAWMAPRGIVAASVASVFSFELAAHGVEGAEQLAPITFLVIVGTVITYGLTASTVGRWLGIAEQNPQGVLIIGADIVARSIGKAIQAQGFRVVLVDTNHQHIYVAKEDGLETYYGDALSEKTSADLSLTGLGRVMGLTPNNEINTLSTIHFSDEFGRVQTFQLSMGAHSEGPPSPLHGRFLFNSKLDHEELNNQLNRGAEIRATILDQDTDYKRFKEIYGDTVHLLFVHTESDLLQVNTIDTPVVPKSQQTLLALYLPESEERLNRYEEALDEGLLITNGLEDDTENTD